MKVFIAIACLAFVAGVYSADTDAKPPRSMVGNLWRFKGDMADNIGEVSDRVIDRIRNLSPFRLLNLNSKPAPTAGQTSIPKPAAVQNPIPAAASPPKSASNPSTASPPPAVPSTTLKPVNCTEQENLKKKLLLAQKHENEAASAKNQAVKDEKTAADGLKASPNDPKLQEDQKKAKSNIFNEQTKEESAHLLFDDLLRKLESYKTCR
ncbi:hypothetical protein PV326_003221 [Microctonus aethiopoides]|nr:hypothetical protein PV326_003221 [Microctonus aethiopoides]